MTTEQTLPVEGIISQMGSIFDEIWERKGAFFVVFFVLFSLFYGFLVWIDFVPEKPEAETVAIAPVAVVATTTQVAQVEIPALMPVVVSANPVRIRIEALGTDVVVVNPQSDTVADLDSALLKGVVRHPDSADFKDTGTMVLFGHSSYLPSVFNKNFKAFNGIQKLVVGNTIAVDSADAVYEYEVTKVYKVMASEASVPLEKGEAKLILVTCNSFGSKDDRYVVEAKLVKKTLAQAIK